MAETVGQHSVAAFTSPVNGTSPIDANTVKGNDNTIRSAYVDHDADPGIHVQSSTLASRPVANSAGRKWMTQDSGVIRLFYDDGTSWYEVDYLRTTGGTISGNLSITGTLAVTGVATFTAQPILSSLTASRAVFTDGSKGLVSNAITGTGDVVMSASPTLTGTITAASATLSGTLGVSGLLTFASLKGTGATTVTNILDEDNMASDSATALATQQSIKAYVDAQVGASDALSEVLAIGNTTGANDIIVSAGQKIRTPAVAAQDGSSAITIANTTGALTLATALADSNLATISTAGKVSNSATTATSANTASAIVARDASGNFTAGTITAALTGNASTATTLQTARNINGVSFNGSADITVTAAAGTLTGSTLASGVTASSLTSVGTLTGLTVSGASPSFNTGNSAGTLTLGTTAAVTQEQRFRLTNSVATSGVELVLSGGGTSWGLYDRTATKWAIQVTRGATDAVSIPGSLAVTDALSTSSTLQASSYAAIGGSVSANAQLYVRGTMVGPGATQYSALVQTTFPAAATSGMNGVYVATTGAAGTYTTTSAIGVNIQPHTLGAGQTVTNAYGMLITSSSYAATTKYGIQIGSVTGGTTNYALYTSSGLVRFGDSLTVSGDLTVDTNTLYVDATNNRVGVGTTSPATALHTYASGTVISQVETGTQYAITRLKNPTHSSDVGVDNTSLYMDSGGAYPIIFYTGSVSTERMRLDASGNLGLGVTPSALSLAGRYFELGYKGNGVLSVSDGTSFVSNAYYDGAWKYGYTGAAAYYANSAGQHRWYTAPSGTAGNAITFTQAMTLDASGNLALNGSTTDIAGYKSFRINGGGSGAFQDFYANSVHEARILSLPSDFRIQTITNAPMSFYTNSTERARITSGGEFLVNATATVNASIASVVGTASTNVLALKNGDNGNYFLYCASTANAERLRIEGDGDVYNLNGTYGTISDIRHKQDVIDAPSQWDDLKAVRFRKYRMKVEVDTNPDAPYLLGVVAQELEQTSPGLVDEHPEYEEQEVTDENGNVTTERVQVGTTKTVKSSILLMKAAVALQEAMARIESLEARLAALES